ncbi:MAG TPA: methyltransferase domain-containing protein [Rhizomicrobium sp.]|nr:methyltransferase domain-containing protein [Rhizomicrobium sp.]
MTAICRHFGACGGCALQDLAPAVYLETKRKMIVEALARQGISDPPLREVVTVPPRSRRRATLKLQKQNDETQIGFHAARSHAVVDMRECHVLTLGLFCLAQQLRDLFAKLLHDAETADLYVVEAENGFDLSISWNRKITPELIAGIAAAAPKLNIIRVTSGAELLYESGVPEITFGKARVKLPPNAFLQPTREGEAMLQAAVIEAAGKARKVADLFCGCGTFSLALAQRAQVHAVDADASMLGVLADAARKTSRIKPVSTEKRDLFRNPLTKLELNRFDAVVLDPPRAGALAQVKQLSSSGVPRIAYVSCDAASFARDARVLIDGGFRLDWVMGIDQFLWSAHIELAAAFSRK